MKIVRFYSIPCSICVTEYKKREPQNLNGFFEKDISKTSIVQNLSVTLTQIALMQEKGMFLKTVTEGFGLL